MSTRTPSAFAAPSGFVAAVTRPRPARAAATVASSAAIAPEPAPAPMRQAA